MERANGLEELAEQPAFSYPTFGHFQSHEILVKNLPSASAFCGLKSINCFYEPLPWSYSPT
jgi:hypothetical protein